MSGYARGLRILLWMFVMTAAPVCAHAQGLSAVQECINSSIKNNEISFTTLPIYDDQKHVVQNDRAISCGGDAAKKMWNQVYPYRTGDVARFKSANNETNEALFFGKHSSCVRRIYDAAHNPASGKFYCYIYLDVTDVMMGSLQ